VLCVCEFCAVKRSGDAIELAKIMMIIDAI
jgi:hypothetical protein